MQCIVLIALRRAMLNNILIVVAIIVAILFCSWVGKVQKEEDVAIAYCERIKL